MFPTDWIMLAEIDGDLISLIVFAVFIVGGSVLRALGNALTKRQKAAQQQIVSRQDEEEEAGDSVYEADQETVQHYLASLMGVKPPQPKAPASQQRSPGRPPQRGATLAQTHPSSSNKQQQSRGVPQRGATLDETHSAEASPQQQSRLQPGAILLKTHAEKSLYVPPPQAPPAPPPPPEARRAKSPSAATEEYQFGTAEPQPPPKHPARKAEPAPAASLARPTLKRAVPVKEHGGRSARERIAFENLSPLKRAIVLREVLDRRRGAHRFLNS